MGAQSGGVSAFGGTAATSGGGDLFGAGTAAGGGGGAFGSTTGSSGGFFGGSLAGSGGSSLFGSLATAGGSGFVSGGSNPSSTGSPFSSTGAITIPADTSNASEEDQYKNLIKKIYEEKDPGKLSTIDAMIKKRGQQR